MENEGKRFVKFVMVVLILGFLAIEIFLLSIFMEDLSIIKKGNLLSFWPNLFLFAPILFALPTIIFTLTKGKIRKVKPPGEPKILDQSGKVRKEPYDPGWFLGFSSVAYGISTVSFSVMLFVTSTEFFLIYVPGVLLGMATSYNGINYFRTA